MTEYKTPCPFEKINSNEDLSDYEREVHTLCALARRNTEGALLMLQDLLKEGGFYWLSQAVFNAPWMTDILNGASVDALELKAGNPAWTWSWLMDHAMKEFLSDSGTGADSAFVTARREARLTLVIKDFDGFFAVWREHQGDYIKPPF